MAIKVVKQDWEKSLDFIAAPDIQASRNSFERNALLKMDLLLVPILGLYFFLSFLDRSNLGNVRIVGLQKDLSMTDFDYSMALTVTFIPYILVEPFANLLMYQIGPSIHIPLLVTIWGLVTCLQGLVTSYHGLLVARFFLGFVEGGLYPAAVLYLSTFYKGSELQLRIALFYGTICAAGVASGLLTYAIINLDGRWGHPGWAWVFLIEGFATSMCGVMGFYFLPASIDKIKFLKNAEKNFLVSRLMEVNQASSAATAECTERSTAFQTWAAVKSIHIMILDVAQFAAISNLFGIAYFTPTVVNTFGYSPTTTQLFTVPPFAVAWIFVVSTSYLSDRYHARGLIASICAMFSITGFAIFYASSHQHVRYGSLFLSIPGAYSVAPNMSAWLADNSAPYKRKAAALAFGTMVGNSGGLFSVWIFTLGHKPRYHLPTAVNLAFGVVVILCCGLNTLWLRHAQKTKVARREEILEKYTLCGTDRALAPGEQDVLTAQAWEDLGDRHPDYKYVY
ncbi:hypothetical protein PCANC_04373 [Puccinia coronata f. sp. avenae]|uniref:Major facilitator superfamily (MFS) profile domain-containing protein n=1 Tax=Puccinia coronata f. sp. avenae TaxID=200324 RepID=A0A2N5VFF5_9BASI|nr:hypothetical protein PCANC_04373 [Puccinia coronata f. sp. avenae]PLW48727.1 hypothetical protein PCASD_03205 [Puccinia coronata f. sp. avenae]